MVSALVVNSYAENRKAGLIHTLPWLLYVSPVLLKFHVAILHDDIVCSIDKDL